MDLGPKDGARPAAEGDRALRRRPFWSPEMGFGKGGWRRIGPPSAWGRISRVLDSFHSLRVGCNKETGPPETRAVPGLEVDTYQRLIRQLPASPVEGYSSGQRG